MGKLWRKLTLLFGRGRFRSELDEEMSFHRAQMEAELVADGVSRDEARYAAKRRFGNATRLQEQSHEAVGFRFETVVQDLRFALRQLRHSPGFAITAVLILALGMGVSVAIFGFVDAALLEPMPYSSPNRLLDVAENAAAFPRSDLSRADYDDWKRQNTTLSALDVYAGTGFLLRLGSTIEPVPAARVSDGFFSTLGVKPMLGRGFLPGEDQPGKPKIAILSYGTWLARFSGRRDVIGQSVSMNGESYTIVGVLPRSFEFAPRRDSEIWVPLLDKNGCEQRRSCHNLYGIGRLRDGVGIDAARADLKRIAKQLEAQYPGSNRGQGAAVQPLSELIVGDVRPILLTLLSGAALLFLIACVNVASLLLVRSESRRREIAVRGALGATPARLIRQFVTEGILLAAAGCAAGLAIGEWLMRLLSHLLPKVMLIRLPFLGDVSMNAHVMLFAVAIVLFASALLAFTPVIRLSGVDIQEALGEGGRTSAGRFWQRLGANLVVVEIAIAVVLLAGAGLLGKSLYKLLHVESGFDTTHLATLNVMAPDANYSTNVKLIALYREINRRLMALPGVQSVGLTNALPLQCNCDTDWIRIEGKPFHGEHNEVNEREVSPDYFATLKAKLVRGRVFTEQDDLSHPQVIVINQALAKKYFPGEDPIGKRIGNGDLAPDTMRQIVGVIRDVREGGLDQDVWPSEYEAIYRTTDNGFSIAVRTTTDEKAMIPSIVNTLHGIDPNMGVYGELTMQQQIDSTEAALLHRLAAWLVGGFAFMALVLGVVGLYGVVAYSVSRRTREIGVRMALGAQRSAVYSLVLRQAGWLTVTGLVFGVACSIGASELMRKLLFGVEAWDMPTLAAVVFVLGCASMAASFLPARRAASVNPTDALRAE
jgi:predicted permease